VSVREKERERERMIESVCVYKREREREKARESTHARERWERERETVLLEAAKRDDIPHSCQNVVSFIGLFCRISSLLWGSFAKETYNFKEDFYKNIRYGVATISRLLKIIRLFCKRAL